MHAMYACVSMETYTYDVRSWPNTRDQREGPLFYGYAYVGHLTISTQLRR